MSIEEARQELLEHAGVVCYDDGVGAILELADAYALAVLEEAIPSRFHTKVERVGVAALMYDELRRRILSLGATETPEEGEG